MKRLKLILLFIIITATTQAQVKYVKTNILHKVKSPIQLMYEGKIHPKLSLSKNVVTTTYPDIATFRIIGPVVGYGVFNNNLIGGVGYGYNRLHYVDSISIYHSKFSINAMLWGAAQLGIPSLNPSNKNIVGVGPAVGLFNNIILIGYCWKAPFIAGTSGQSDLVIVGHLPIN